MERSFLSLEQNFCQMQIFRVKLFFVIYGNVGHFNTVLAYIVSTFFHLRIWRNWQTRQI